MRIRFMVDMFAGLTFSICRKGKEMTITEELRRMLDERGVEYNDRDMFGKHVFHWGEPLHGAMFTDGGEWTELVVENATPAQAIDATLGRGTCHNAMPLLSSGMPYPDSWMCSECGGRMDGIILESGNYCPNCGRRLRVSE